MNLILIFGLRDTIDHLLPMENSVHWYGRVLRIEDGHVISMAYDFAVEGHRKKEHGQSR